LYHIAAINSVPQIKRFASTKHLEQPVTYRYQVQSEYNQWCTHLQAATRGYQAKAVMATDQEKEGGGRLGLVIGILIAVSVLLVGGLIIFLLLIVNRPGTAASANAPLPYNVNLRPFPTATRAQDLLPAKVGSFARRTLSGSLGNVVTAIISANYADGANTALVKVSLDANVAQAQAEVNQQMNNSSFIKRNMLASSNFSYVLGTDKSGAVHFIYAKGYWVFDVTGNSQAALDAFMKVFPY